MAYHKKVDEMWIIFNYLAVKAWQYCLLVFKAFPLALALEEAGASFLALGHLGEKVHI